MNNKQKAFVFFLAAFSILIWGITFVCTKYLLKDFSSLEILFYRFLTAYIGLLIIHPKFEKIEKRDNFFIILASLSGIIVYQLFENIAIHFTNASNVSVIVSICPLFTAIINQIFLKEKHLSLWFIIGFLVSITGVVLVCFNGNTALEFNPKGDLLALASAICWGFYSMLISILNKKNYDPICLTRRLFFYAVVIMIPLSLMGWRFSIHGVSNELTLGSNITAGDTSVSNSSDFLSSLYFILDKSVNARRFSNMFNWLNILFLGIVGNGICLTAWNKACKMAGTVKVSCALYLIPVVTIIFAFFALDEKITLLGGIGALLTITGLFLSEKRKK